MGELTAWDVATLPADARALLAAAQAEDFQFGEGWLRATAAAALPEGTRPRLLLYREARAIALLPLQASGRRLAGLGTMYTTRYRPPVAADATPAELRRAGAAFAGACRGVVRLDALDADWPPLAPLLAGLRDAGVVARHFAHFGNWHTEVADWPGYLAQRPGELRGTIKRRLARLGRDPFLAFTLVDTGDEAALADGIAAYEAVYARSWKPAEPFPAFTAALLGEAAQAGVLRLGVLRHQGAPVAAQYWLLAGGTATVMKLAHDEAAKALAPGTVLTALMIRRLIEHGARALDFGRGDDSYKAGWTGQRRQRIGVLLCRPRHPAGLATLSRHFLAEAYKTIFRRENDDKR